MLPRNGFPELFTLWTMPKQVPFVRSSYLQAYVFALRAQGVDPDPVLRASGLPTGLAFQPDCVVAGVPLHSFIRAATRLAPPGEISMIAGLHHAQAHRNPFSVALHMAVTLGDAIRMHNENVGHFSPGNRFDLARQATGVRWFKKGRSPQAESEIFCVANLIGHVGSVIGERWRPSSVEVSTAEPGTLRALRSLGDVDIRQVAESTAVEIPQAHFSAHVACTGERRACGGSDLGTFDPNTLDFAESLRLVMLGYARVGSLTLDSVTQAAGVSRRTLQRWLRNRGLTYSELADRVRFEIASDMLRHHKEVSVTRIGYELGFSDPGSFSRAFRRFTGVAPAEFRRRSMWSYVGARVS